MPNIEFRGSSSAMGFGLFGGAGAEPPGSYTHPMCFAGSAYQPEGWATVDLELYGAGGGQAGNYNGGTKLIANDIPNNGNLEVYTPTTASSGKSSQATSYAGNGGNGGSTNGPTLYSGHPGGGASYASWTGGSMVAAGGGGTGGVSSMHPGRKRNGLYETAPSSGDSRYTGSGRDWNSPNSGRNGGNGQSGGCYYGGGGGGGGSSQGGYGADRQNGGSAGGHLGGTVGSNGGSSGDFDNYTVNSASQNMGRAIVKWGD